MNAMLNSSMEFLTTDMGRMIAQFFNVIYQLFFPANAPGATPVPLPDTTGH